MQSVAQSRNSARTDGSFLRDPAFRVSYDEVDASVICHVVGNLEQGSAPQFRDAVAEVIGKERIIFEVSAVPFVDSAGLGALIGCIRLIREHGGDAVVCGARASVSKVFHIVGLARVVAVVDDLDQALQHFG